MQKEKNKKIVIKIIKNNKKYIKLDNKIIKIHEQ